MSREVPDGWTPVKLGAAALNVAEKWEPGEHAEPYVGLEQVGQGTGRLLDIGVSDGLQSIKTRFRAGDVLFGKLRPNLKKTALVDFSGIASTDILVIRPSERMTPEFAFYRVSSDEAFDYAIKSAAGTKMPRTSWKDMADFEFPLPPLHEQRGIAEILSSVDEAIAATRAVIEQTRKVRSEILSTSFPEDQAAGPSTANDTFEGWSVEPASSICESIIDCKNRTPPVTEDGYAVVRTPNVRNGRFRYEGLQFTDKQSFQEWTAKGIPRAGDILFTREAPYGEVCMAPAMAFCLGQRMMFLRPDTSRVSSDFLLYALQSGPVKKEMFRRAGGSTVGHLRVGDVRELPIPVAPRDVQLHLTSTLRSLDVALYSNEESLSRLEGCKFALMSDLLTGRKRVSDALPMAAE
ncbi:restriction endonuclease subunit S [uncultured Agrobacterium sp.]|uniref:restriction endonuclease subunit S n=1 Tax=uncultured Agrobacterium sp. TaxID=157277 RepID=UPI0025CDC776|nr:restriction endonuclease subunit S [uncultured Agrobacterium sp.]